MNDANQTELEKMQSFNPTIANLKAFCIMMVVLGHCDCSIPYAMQFMGMFRMPLFFFVSGYCFKATSLDNPKRYFGRRIQGVYWPCVKWGLFFMLLHNVFIKVGFYDASTPVYGIRDFILHAYNIIVHMVDLEQLIGAYWFLAALFAGSFISWVLMKFVRQVEYSAAIAFGAAILMNALEHHIPLGNPLFTFIPFSYILVSARTFEVAFLIIAGHWFAYKKIKPFGWKMIVLITLLTFIGSFYWKINTGLMFFENWLFIPYQITGLLFTWCLYSMFFGKIQRGGVYKVMSFIGKNTLTILTWQFLSFKVVSLTIIGIYNLPVEKLSEFPVIHEYAAKGWWLIYFVVALISCCGVAYCNRWIKNSWLKL